MNQQQIVSLLTPLLQDIEQKRIHVQKQIKRTTVVAKAMLVVGSVGAIFFLFAMLPTLGKDAQLMTILVCFFIFILWYLQQRTKENNEQKRADFEHQVKTEVYQKVFQTWNASSQYIPDACVEEEYFKAAGLHHGYSIYSGDDYCTGQLPDGRNFRFSELLTQRVEHWEDNAPHKIPVFKGLFFVIDNTLPFEDFDGRLTIEPKPRKPKEELKQKRLPPKKSIPKPKNFDENILDADFLNQDFIKKEKGAKKPIPPLFDRLYNVKDFGNPFAKEKLPLEFCQQLGYLKSLLQHQISVTFYQNKLYFSSRHQFDFWPVALDYSLLNEARIQRVAANFAAVFLLLEKIANTTLPIPNS